MTGMSRAMDWRTGAPDCVPGPVWRTLHLSLSSQNSCGSRVVAWNLRIQRDSVTCSRAPGRKQSRGTSDPLTSPKQTDTEERTLMAKGVPQGRSCFCLWSLPLTGKRL